MHDVKCETIYTKQQLSKRITEIALLFKALRPVLSSGLLSKFIYKDIN